MHGIQLSSLLSGTRAFSSKGSCCTCHDSSFTQLHGVFRLLRVLIFSAVHLQQVWPFPQASLCPASCVVLHMVAWWGSSWLTCALSQAAAAALTRAHMLSWGQRPFWVRLIWSITQNIRLHNSSSTADVPNSHVASCPTAITCI
jgi:hypothetical protein